MIAPHFNAETQRTQRSAEGFFYFLTSATLCVLCASALNLRAAEPDKDDPAAELASFKLPPGFQANLFASEKDGVIKRLAILNLERNRCIEVIDDLFREKIVAMNGKVTRTKPARAAGKRRPR